MVDVGAVWWRRVGRIGVLGLVLVGSGWTATAAECDALRHGRQPVRIDYFQMFETDPLKPQSAPVYQDIVRENPDEIVQYLHRNSKTLKAVYFNSLFPRAFWSPDGGSRTTVEYDTDVTKLQIGPGLSTVVRGRLVDAKGIVTPYQNEIEIGEGGVMRVDGCDYPVLKIQRRSHVVREGKPIDTTAEVLYSPDLKSSLRLRNGPIGSLGYEVLLATHVSVATDIPGAP